MPPRTTRRPNIDASISVASAELDTPGDAESLCCLDGSGDSCIPSHAATCEAGQVWDALSRTCVGCASHSDCKDPEATSCDKAMHSCQRCTVDSDCSHIDGPKRMCWTRVTTRNAANPMWPMDFAAIQADSSSICAPSRATRPSSIVPMASDRTSVTRCSILTVAPYEYRDALRVQLALQPILRARRAFALTLPRCSP